MAAAARITFRFVLIVDLACSFLVAPAPLLSGYLAPHKTDAGHEIVLEYVVFTAI